MIEVLEVRQARFEDLPATAPQGHQINVKPEFLEDCQGYFEDLMTGIEGAGQRFIEMKAPVITDEPEEDVSEAVVEDLDDGWEMLVGLEDALGCHKTADAPKPVVLTNGLMKKQTVRMPQAFSMEDSIEKTPWFIQYRRWWRGQILRRFSEERWLDSPLYRLKAGNNRIGLLVKTDEGWQEVYQVLCNGTGYLMADIFCRNQTAKFSPQE